ncbi:MAG: DUF4350 domain-containing protein [Zoogloeaceae bacterium]|jgi:hypothetical protein|nr:DUF4350 domain-containing protein [Zoogloeaceae bacterium]
MSRSVLLWIVGGCVCVALAVYLFANLERVSIEKRGRMSLEARRNPQLATERFFHRMGRETARIESPVALDALPEGGVLVLAGRRASLMNEARAQRILDWVARGGYLIVEHDRGLAEKDPLLLPFGVTNDDDTTEEKPDIIRRERGASSLSTFIEVGLPGNDQRYRLTSWLFRKMSSGEIPPLWQVEGQYGNAMLHYAWGRGNVTLVGNLMFLNNGELGNFDHAEFFWALLQRYQPEGVIHLAARMEYQTLWQWLSTTAWRTLPSAAILILIWLFCVMPRFGGVRAAMETERRGLAEHLLALGRCLWREGALDILLDTARREIAQRLAQRHARLSRLPAKERSRELARQSGLAATEIDAALHSNAPPSPETFTRAMQIVQSLERAL